LPAVKGGHQISNRIYIGDISFGVAEEYIKEFLCGTGRVISMHFMKDRHSFQPKWFGFVEMASEAEAKKAMEALNGKMLLNRPLIILKRNIGMTKMPKTKPCSFCIAKGTCNKPEAERESNCKDYMLKTKSEKGSNE
jgi:RNA recognition motif-containing protein